MNFVEVESANFALAQFSEELPPLATLK